MARTVPIGWIAIGVVLFGTVAWAAGNRRPSDEERGRELYDRHCVACHGQGARGDGPATDDLVQPVPTLEGKLTSDNVDDHVQVVLIGRGTMPGFETSFDRYDARRVLRHAARLAEAPAPTPRPRPAAPSLPDPADSDTDPVAPTDDTDVPSTDAP